MTSQTMFLAYAIVRKYMDLVVSCPSLDWSGGADNMMYAPAEHS
jgi:hypothetical protein